jgi:hypothetical protein
MEPIKKERKSFRPLAGISFKKEYLDERYSISGKVSVPLRGLVLKRGTFVIF